MVRRQPRPRRPGLLSARLLRLGGGPGAVAGRAGCGRCRDPGLLRAGRRSRHPSAPALRHRHARLLRHRHAGDAGPARRGRVRLSGAGDGAGLRSLPVVLGRPGPRPAGARLRRAARAAPAVLRRPLRLPAAGSAGPLGSRLSRHVQPRPAAAGRAPADRAGPAPARAALRGRGTAIPGRHCVARQRRAHRPPAAGRACRLLFEPALRAQRHPGRHGAPRPQPQRAPVRGGRLRDADSVRRLGGARPDPRAAAEIAVVRDADDVVRELSDPDEGARRRRAWAARRRVLARHTAGVRAAELEACLAEAARGRSVAPRGMVPA